MKGIVAFDTILGHYYLSLTKGRPSLIVIMCHNLFQSTNEIHKNHVDPQQEVTISHFHKLIEIFLEKGYEFITPSQLSSGLNNQGHYAMITFDDGYYNNHLALPSLKEFNVPANFFISVNHIKTGKSFWWDALYRERKKRGSTSEQIEKEAKSLKQFKNEKIEQYLKEEFGKGVLTPVSDIDRPFTVDELKQFASNQQVHIGNHSMDHAILTNYAHEEIYWQITEAQKTLKKWTGKFPEMIAYPDGRFNDEVISLAKQSGLKYGVTVQPGKNYLPLNQEKLFQIKRFTYWANVNLNAQLKRFRSDVSLSEYLGINYSP